MNSALTRFSLRQVGATTPIKATFWYATVLMVVAAPTLARAANINDFIDFSLRGDSNNLLLPGRLYVPPEASTPSEPRPLILFLHGAGESGTNNAAQVNGNIDNLLAEAKERGAFLYAPQTNGGWGSTMVTERAATMLDRALSEQNVDLGRVYLTGLSMGGGGVWNMLERYGDRFAASVPICAVSPASGFAPANMLDEPIWAFHARNDSVVSVNSSRGVVNSILNALPEPLPTYPSLRDQTTPFHFDSSSLDLHYTEPATGGHGIWGAVYAHEPMYDWLFSHGPVPEPGAFALAACGGAMIFSYQHRRRRQPASAAMVAAASAVSDDGSGTTEPGEAAAPVVVSPKRAFQKS